LMHGFPLFCASATIDIGVRSFHLFLSHLEWQAWDTAVFRVTFSFVLLDWPDIVSCNTSNRDDMIP
jgi:hypothetical protein